MSKFPFMLGSPPGSVNVTAGPVKSMSTSGAVLKRSLPTIFRCAFTPLSTIPGASVSELVVSVRSRLIEPVGVQVKLVITDVLPFPSPVSVLI